MSAENLTEQIKWAIRNLYSLDGGDQQSAAQKLTKIGEAAVEPLINELSSDNKWARSWAAWALGKIGDARAIQPLFAAFYSKDLFLSDRAAQALGQYKLAEVTMALLDALDSESSSIRSNAAYALSMNAEESAIEALVKTLRDEEIWVRAWTALGLGRIGGPQIPDILYNLATEDNSGIVRNFAARGLALLGDKRAIKPLIESLEINPDTDRDNTNWEIRHHAAIALVNLAPSEAVELALNTGDIRLSDFIHAAFGGIFNKDYQKRLDTMSHIQLLQHIKSLIDRGTFETTAL